MEMLHGSHPEKNSKGYIKRKMFTAKSVVECTVTATTANGKKVTCKVKVVPGTATIKATNNGYNSIKLTWNQTW